MTRILNLEINGKLVEDVIGDNVLLIDYLRDKRGLTGAKTGCDGGECGACTVLVNGRARLSCVTLAATCEGARIETIEGQARGGRLSPLQRAFHEHLGTQCGFCTPGMIMAAEGLLRQNQTPDVDAVKSALGGNLCRCTGYTKIIDAVMAVAGSGAQAPE